MMLVVLKIRISPERREDWLRDIARYTTAVRAEPGNLSFDCYESLDVPNEFAIVEGFASEEAGSAHVQTGHFAEFMEWFPEVIATAPQIINTQVEGWSTMSELE